MAAVAATLLAASFALAGANALCGEGGHCTERVRSSLQVKQRSALAINRDSAFEEALLYKPEVQSKTKSDIANLQELVMKAVEDEKGGNKTSVPFRDLVKKLTEDIKAHLLDISNGMKDLIKKHRDDFDFCKKVPEVNLTTLDLDFAAKQKLHGACLPEENGLKFRAVMCRKAVDALNAATKAKCELKDALTPATPRIHFSHALPQFNYGDSYKAWLEKVGTIQSKMYKQYSEAEAACLESKMREVTAENSCKQDEEVYVLKSQECEGLGVEMDDASCAAVAGRIQICEQTTSCHSTAAQNYADLVAVARPNMQERKQDWQAIGHMECIVGMLGGKGFNIKPCQEKQVDTTHLDISFFSEPTQAPCDHLTTYACTADYVANEYGAEYQDRCKQCPVTTPIMTTTLVPIPAR